MTIAADNLFQFAYTNMHLCNAVRGAVLDFHGLDGGRDFPREDDEWARLYAAMGLLFVYPYLEPWNWINDTAVRTVDEILDVLLKAHPGIPVVSSGGSMGGTGALLFALRSRHQSSITACAAHCPVADVPGCFGEAADVPRTLAAAFGHYDMDMNAALESVSPLHRAGELPRIPYLIVQGARDTDVPKAQHADRLVSALRAVGHDVTYIVDEGRGHCDFSPESFVQYFGFVSAAAGGMI